MSGDKKRQNSVITEQQISELSQNPYVRKVSATSISFTEEFKKYYQQQREAGLRVRDIFINAGINPDYLGEKRLEGFRYQMKSKEKNNIDFSDKRANNGKQPEKPKDDSTEARLKYLEHALAYTQQEVEFLKKIQMANTEARKQWELKHRPK